MDSLSSLDPLLLSPVADSQPKVGNTTAYDTIREGAEHYTTDGVNFEQLIADEVAHYFHVVIMPSVQRHRLLSLLCLSLSRLCRC